MSLCDLLKVTQRDNGRGELIAYLDTKFCSLNHFLLGKKIGFGIRQIWIQILALPLTGYMTFSKLLVVHEPLFPYLSNEDDNSIYLFGLLRGLNKKIDNAHSTVLSCSIINCRNSNHWCCHYFTLSSHKHGQWAWFLYKG